MKYRLWLLCAAILVAGAGASAMPQRKRASAVEETAIRKALEQGAAAWNRGDLDAFMAGYEDSPETLYVESTGITAGYRQIGDRYRKKYPSRQAMGILRMTGVQIRMLGSGYALAIGKWNVARGSSTASGYFTLTFHKTAAGWRIAVDHTC